MATPRLGLVVEDKPTELSCISVVQRMVMVGEYISKYYNM